MSILFLAAASVQVLKGLEQIQPPFLFSRLVDGSNPALDTIYTFACVIGFFIIIGGHLADMDECQPTGGAQMRVWLRSVAVICAITFSGQLASGVNTLVRGIETESGLGSPMGVVGKCWSLAMSFPEWGAAYTDPAYQEKLDGEWDNVKKLAAQGDINVVEKWMSYVAIKMDGATYGSSVRKAWDAGGGNPIAGIVNLLTGVFKVLVALLFTLGMLLPLLFAALGSWFISCVQYFLIIAGHSVWPLFLAGYRTKTLRSQAHNYTMGYIAVISWPLGWVLGHAGTVMLFNALVAGLAGTTVVPSVLAWDNIEVAVENGAAVATGVWAVSAVAGVPMLPAVGVAWLIAAVIGILGLSFWIIVVTFYGPVLVTKLLVSGADFFQAAAQGAVGATTKTAATLASLAATAAGGGAGFGAVGAADAGGGAGGGAIGGGGAGGVGTGEGSSGGAGEEAPAGGGGSSGGGGRGFGGGRDQTGLGRGIREVAKRMREAPGAALGHSMSRALATLGEGLAGGGDPASLGGAVQGAANDFMQANFQRAESGDEQQVMRDMNTNLQSMNANIALMAKGKNSGGEPTH